MAYAYVDIYEGRRTGIEVIDSCINRNNTSVLDMLNTKYLIVGDPNQGQKAQINPAALGNAWFVNEYTLVENADAEMAEYSS